MRECSIGLCDAAIGGSVAAAAAENAVKVHIFLGKEARKRENMLMHGWCGARLLTMRAMATDKSIRGMEKDAESTSLV